MMLPLALLLACRDAAPTRPNVLVLDLDTLRADRIGRERNGESITPHIDALARRGTRFDQMVAQSGWTLPSLAALLTGNLPLGALQQVPGRDVQWILPDTRTVPEIVALYDYRTIVFYGRTLPANFPVMREPFAEHGDPPQAPPDADAARELVRWLADSPKEPWFALVHTADLHHQMSEVPRDELDRYAPDHVKPCLEPGSLAYPQLVARWAKTLGREAAEELFRAHYDAVVRHYDEDVGEMIAALEREGLRNRTIVVVLSDHGQELFEHGNADHGPPYQFNLRVPLVIDDPTHPPGPGRIATMVQTIDVAPTILELLGIPIDREMEGKSLVPLLRGTEGYVERPVLSITDPHRVAVRTHGWALLRCAVPGCGWSRPGEPRPAAPALELYDLAGDPEQHANVAGTGLAVEQELTVLLDALPAPSPRRKRIEAVSDAMEKILRERGYWDAGPAAR
jgi:arylsulfatase A-like enzyme